MIVLYSVRYFRRSKEVIIILIYSQKYLNYLVDMDILDRFLCLLSCKNEHILGNIIFGLSNLIGES